MKMRTLRRNWNRFLNWIFPGRKARILSKMTKRDQELGLYEEDFNLKNN